LNAETDKIGVVLVTLCCVHSDWMAVLC